MTSDTYDADALGPLDPDGAGADPGAAGQPAAGQQVADDNVVAAEDEAATRMLTDIDALQRERDDLLEMSKRLQADFENYRKRVLREQTVLVERASEGLVEQLLPVLDSFELALANFPEVDGDNGGVRKGIELVHAELLGVLERAGLEPIRALGAPFDPNEHEAVMHDDDGDGEPHVAGVLRTGWRLKGRVLRPAMVKVAR